MNTYVKLNLFFAITVIAGCSTHNPVPLNGVSPVTNNKEVKSPVSDIIDKIGDGNVVFIRRYAQPTAFAVSVRVNGDKIASLSQRKFTAISLPAGEYLGKTKWPLLSSQLSLEFPLKISGDKIQFFEIFGENSISYGGVQNTVSNEVAVRELSSDEGANYIANCCKYVSPNK